MNIRRRFFETAARFARWIKPKPDHSRVVAVLEGVVQRLTSEVAAFRSGQNQARESFLEMVSEMAEAAHMAGAG
ncbi:MAG: hypothetical protein ACREMY_32015, partial [bacterium]